MSTTNLIPNTVNVNLFGYHRGFMKSVHAAPNKEVDLKGISSTATRTSYDDKYWAISFIFRSLGAEGQELVTHEIFDNPRDVAILEAITADTPITVTPVFTRPPGSPGEELTLQVTVYTPTEITGTVDSVGNGKGTKGIFLTNI